MCFRKISFVAAIDYKNILNFQIYGIINLCII